MAVVHVVLCGGFGKRLWPLSRVSYPKPFVPLMGQPPLFEQTIKRNFAFCDALTLVTNAVHGDLVQGFCDRLLQGTSRKLDILLEPSGQNTAASIALAALQADPEDILWVTPADHWIVDDGVYQQECELVLKLAESQRLLTLGITPTYASTQYGYIQKQLGTQDAADLGAFPVQAFHEKPNASVAETYVAQQDYFWNSGMFCFQSQVFLTELQQHVPDLYQAVVLTHDSIYGKKSGEKSVFTYDANFMQAIPKLSVDVAVMEKSEAIWVLPSKMDWRDLGDFDQLAHFDQQDSAGNTQSDQVMVSDAKNNFVAASSKPVALVGVEDLVVADTEDALLIAKKGQVNGVQDLVNRYADTAEHAAVFKAVAVEKRPWGSFRVLEDAATIKIKEITVLPKSRLSLQTHQHRREHWVVIAGEACVEVEDAVLHLSVGESVDISLGAKHRLSNQGDVDLRIIEVQFGTYFGEDDIVRLEDDYQRLSL